MGARRHILEAAFLCPCMRCAPDLDRHRCGRVRFRILPPAIVLHCCVPIHACLERTSWLAGSQGNSAESPLHLPLLWVDASDIGLCLVLCSVHRMVRNLGKHLLEQECTVLGSRNGPECAVFNRSGAQADHVPQRCVLQVQNPESQLFVTEYIADTNVHLHSVPEPKQGKERVPRQHMSL